MKSKLKYLLCLCITALMVSSITLTSFATEINKNYGVTSYGVGTSISVNNTQAVSYEKANGKVDLSKVVMNNFSDKVKSVDEFNSVTTKNIDRNVIVTLSSPSLLDYAGNIPLSSYLQTNDGLESALKIKRAQDKIFKELHERGVKYKVVNRFNAVTNAIVLDVDTEELSEIKKIKEVKSAVVSETYLAPETESGVVTNPSNMFATGIYNTTGYDDYGYGTTVAVLDTGLDYTHDAFSDKYDVDETRFGLEQDEVQSVLGNLSSYSKTEKMGKTLQVEDVYLSRKVPFAYDYADNDADVYPAYSQHGVHVAGIIAGESDHYYDKDGKLVKDGEGNLVPFRGSSPKAQLVICKVFTDNLESKNIGGAESENIIAALDDCVKLGVDVINMSLGTSCGFSSLYLEGDDEGQQLYTIYERIKQAGISLMCAASNDYSSGYGSAYGTNLKENPDSSTVGSPSTFEGAMSIASINGQTSPYMKVGSNAVFFEEASNANSVPYDFVEQMLKDKQSETYKYVIVPGVGEAVDYTQSVKRELSDKSSGKTIAVVKRGKTNFQEKVELAMEYADAIIVYNNVAGTIRMNLGNIVNPIPAVSVSIDAGEILRKGANARGVGKIEVNREYSAGPFMNDYSSWGPTPDLKLKPDVTAHGGEIISAVSGGYAEMSGTSMATPNIAGLAALVRSYVIQTFGLNRETDFKQINTLTNQLLMSTAITVYNELNLPYSPRKQGSGLATVSNVFNTKAYLYTDESNGGAEDNRPKLELGQDVEKNGVYNLKFYVNNFSNNPLEFTVNSLFFTETVAIGGLAVAERAYMLDGSPQWTANGNKVDEGATITVDANGTMELSVTLTLSDSEKKYIDKNFKNGMFVEGFLKLVSKTDGQCDLNLPFLGFYGDFSASDMLDYDCYEIAKFEQDTSLDEDEKPKAGVWATQAYSLYYNEKYVLPLGEFVYLQNEDLDAKDKLFVNSDYASISCYNDYYGEGNLENYLTSTGIKALYAGLLRNAELVTYEITDAETGELIVSRRKYRVGKAYSGGGQGVPAQVLMEERPADLGLVANGKYKIDFNFYATVADENKPISSDNTFTMTFYIDYEAPVLTDARIRYYEYEESNRTKQRIYLDIDIFDNHYPQAVLLCYADKNTEEKVELMLATEYVTPVLRPNKNGTTTVSLEITEIYSKYKDRLYVQIDDYALNHNIYKLNFNSSKIASLPDDFTIKTGAETNYEITIGVNEAKKIELEYEGEANPSSFIYNSNARSIIEVQDGEMFGVREGQATISVSNGKGVIHKLKVKVVDKNIKLNYPSIKFGAIENSERSLVPAIGTVDVSAGKTFMLDVITDPWYYDKNNLTLKWSSTNDDVATVTQQGEVTTKEKRGIAVIKAVIMNDGKETMYTASVILNVEEPFTINNMTLTRYNGFGGHVVLPDDENIIYIGAEAFKDNDKITSIVIPETVQYINERAFVNCKNLEAVYFVSTEKQEIATSDLSLIYRNAFSGCTSLKKVDLSNVKVVTLDKTVFYGCKALKEIVDMHKIVKMDDLTFAYCTSLEEADLSGLHTAGIGVFDMCTSLKRVKTDRFTVLGRSMFSGCTSLSYSDENNKEKGIILSISNIPSYAFEYCGAIEKVTFESNLEMPITIGDYAFLNSLSLKEIDFSGNDVLKVGECAFSGCKQLSQISYPNKPTLGSNIYNGTQIPSQSDVEYVNTTLYRAPQNISETFEILNTTTKIAPYAFENCIFPQGYELVLPSSVTEIGEGVFKNSNLSKIRIEGTISEIPDYAFYGTQITSLSNIIKTKEINIGNSAFAQSQLESLDIEVNRIGNYAFENNPFEEITIKANEIGNYAVLGSEQLKQARLESSKIGNGTFNQCTALETLTLALATGQNTCIGLKSLRNVTLENLTIIGKNAFANCANLQEIETTKAIYVIEDGAFEECTSLTLATKTSIFDYVTNIGARAFKNVPLSFSDNVLRLPSVKIIGDSAFEQTNENKTTITSISMMAIEEIGARAFYNSKVAKITLPSTLEKFGAGAFASSDNLTTYEIAEGGNFFAEGGVLYRNIKSHKNATKIAYEIVAYPTNNFAPLSKDEHTRVYRIKDGTISVLANAFSEIKRDAITQIILPYSMQVIGDEAFYASGISEYVFESYVAPRLLSQFRDNNTEGFFSYINANFEKYIGDYVVDKNVVNENATRSTLRLYAPTNGQGYDNFYYSVFFLPMQKTGIVMEDSTREVKNLIESFISPAEVAQMQSLEVNETNKAKVQEFSDKVKEAHRLYNNVKDKEQLAFIGEENEQKLFAIEKELKSIKAKFSIAVRPTALTIAPDSAHKTQYKEGDKFDMSGLKIIIEYDDYSTEVADMSKITLSSESDKQLNEYDLDVKVEGYGRFLRIGITVTPAEITNVQNKDFNPAWIYVPIICVVGAGGIGVGVFFLVRYLKKKKN